MNDTKICCGKSSESLVLNAKTGQNNVNVISY